MLRHCGLFEGIGGLSVISYQLSVISDQFSKTVHCSLFTVLTSLPAVFPVPEPAALANETDSLIPTQPSGEKESAASEMCRPRFCVIEQPEGVVRRGLRAVLGGLRMAGYAYEVELISAQQLGAGQSRPRLFVISYPDQWRSLFTLAPGWSDQVREMVQRQRADSPWLSVERPSNGSDDQYCSVKDFFSLKQGAGSREKKAINAFLITKVQDY